MKAELKCLSINVFEAFLNTIFPCFLIGMWILLPGEIMSYNWSYSSCRDILPLYWVNLYQLQEGHSWQILSDLFLRAANLESLQFSSVTCLVLRSPSDRKSFLKSSLKFSYFKSDTFLTFLLWTLRTEDFTYIKAVVMSSCFSSGYNSFYENSLTKPWELELCHYMGFFLDFLKMYHVF